MPRQVITSIETTTTSTPSRSTDSVEGNDCIYEAMPEVKPDISAQPLDKEPLNSAETLRLFESAIESLTPSAARSYAKAVASLRSFISAFLLDYTPLSTATIADWLITLRLDGIALSTLTLYLNAISALHNRIGATADAGSLPAIDFTTLRARLAETIDTREVAAPRRVIARDAGSDKGKAQEADAIPAPLLNDLYTTAVIAGGIPLETAARLRAADLDRYPVQVSEIARRWSDPRRKYIFPLRQTAYTPRQLARRLADAMAAAPDSRLRALPSPSYTWLRTAMQCGATPGEAIAILGRDPLLHHPHGDITRLLHREDDREEARPRASHPQEAGQGTGGASHPQETGHRLFQLIADAITSDPLRWYALRYRQGVTHEEIAERLAHIAADEEASIRPEATFYPCEEIATRKDRGPIRHNLQPVLPGILFIRTRITHLQPLLRRLSDLAWCYRDPSRRDHGYAPIPDTEMQTFQLAIGIFTPETTVAPLGTIPPRPGQPIEILGGPFAGRPALFLAEVPAPTVAPAAPSSSTTSSSTTSSSDQPTPGTEQLPPIPTTLYRLLLPGDNGIDWEATLDPRLLRPL